MYSDELKRKITDVIGKDFCFFEQSILQDYQRTTFPTDIQVGGLVKARNKNQLVELVKLANLHKFPLYPLSTGQNYGYGSKVPTCQNALIIDLSAMNKIIAYDEKMGTLTVEPGVSFEQVFHFLGGHRSKFTMAGTGAPPQSSLIGNALERGLGKGMAGNRAENICNIEAILPTGDVVHTGMGRYQNSKVKTNSKYAPGPLLDGLFTQSNFGIITEMTFWLTLRPKNFTTFFYLVDDASKLPKIVDALRTLKQKDIIRSSSTIFNNHRILGFMGKYPWDLSDGSRSLTDQETHIALKRHMPMAALWYGDGALFCHSRAQARAERKMIKQALKGLVKHLVFFREPQVSLLEMAVNFMRRFSSSSLFNPLDFYFKRSLYLGDVVPKAMTLGSTYVRKTSGVPPVDQIDPDKHGCGTYWMGPIVPFDGLEVKKATDLISKIITSYGYEPAMTLQLVSARQIDIIISISYDRDILGEDEKAKKCHDHLLEELCQQGLYPYRLGNQSQHLMPDTDDATHQFIHTLKKAVDPNLIMAPGRYDFKLQP